MTNATAAPPHCAFCDNTGWMCEDHPEKPWGGFSRRSDACHCGGAGMPCPYCNPADEDNPPDMSRTGLKTDIDKDTGRRH
jgi:hypothetical protein